MGKSDVANNGGKILLEMYEGSVYMLLKENFPEIEWLPWKFDNQRWLKKCEKKCNKKIEGFGKTRKVIENSSNGWEKS